MAVVVENFNMADEAGENTNNSNEYVKPESSEADNSENYCKRVLTIKKEPAKCGMYTYNDGSRY